MFAAGSGSPCRVLNVYFRDVQYLVGILLQLWFYATPIVYPITVVPETATILGAEIPRALPLRAEPDGPLRRGHTEPSAII